MGREGILFGAQRYSGLQFPSYKPNKQVLPLVATILGAKYDHIPSIRNGDVAFAARAIVLLYDRG